jgi:hypothetical protein
MPIEVANLLARRIGAMMGDTLRPVAMPMMIAVSLGRRSHDRSRRQNSASNRTAQSDIRLHPIPPSVD